MIGYEATPRVRRGWLNGLSLAIGLVPTPPDARDAEIASLRASLDDAHREISRLTGEKHKRDSVIRKGIEVLESLHRQGEQP